MAEAQRPTTLCKRRMKLAWMPLAERAGEEVDMGISGSYLVGHCFLPCKVVQAFSLHGTIPTYAHPTLVSQP